MKNNPRPSPLISRSVGPGVLLACTLPIIGFFPLAVFAELMMDVYALALKVMRAQPPQSEVVVDNLVAMLSDLLFRQSLLGYASAAASAASASTRLLEGGDLTLEVFDLMQEGIFGGKGCCNGCCGRLGDPAKACPHSGIYLLRTARGKLVVVCLKCIAKNAN